MTNVKSQLLRSYLGHQIVSPLWMLHDLLSDPLGDTDEAARLQSLIRERILSIAADANALQHMTDIPATDECDRPPAALIRDVIKQHLSSICPLVEMGEVDYDTDSAVTLRQLNALIDTIAALIPQGLDASLSISFTPSTIACLLAVPSVEAVTFDDRTTHGDDLSALPIKKQFLYAQITHLERQLGKEITLSTCTSKKAG